MSLIIRNIIHTVLILLLMVATSGASVLKHYCTTKGRMDISVTKHVHCCKEKTEKKDSKNCCSYEQQQKADFIKKDKTVSVDGQTFLITVVSDIMEYLFFFHFTKNDPDFISSSSPVLSGRDKLILHQTFLI